jgi:hypothetical protein
MLRLDEGEAMEWDRYSHALRVSHVRINEEKDNILWGNISRSGSYTPKVVYNYFYTRIEEA